MSKKNINSIIKKKKIGLLIIARSSSKRFKNKIESKILNYSILEILIKRLINRDLDNKNIVLCTSIKDKKNNFFKKICKKYKIKIYYGSDKNIFNRIINCSKLYNFKHIVRITGDNPFTDLEDMKKLIQGYFKKKYDYGYITGISEGLKSEILNIKSLIYCKKNSVDENSSEYLTYFFLRKIFNIYNLKKYEFNKAFLKTSFTIDYKKDLKKINKIVRFNNNNIYLNKKKLINTSLKLGFVRKKIITKTIKLVTSKYNVRLKTDLKSVKKINLREFGIV